MKIPHSTAGTYLRQLSRDSCLVIPFLLTLAGAATDWLDPGPTLVQQESGIQDAARPSTDTVEFETDWISYRTSEGGSILFPVRVNGVDLVALLDTAAPVTIIDTAVVSRLGLHERGPRSGDGRDFSRTAERARLEVGGASTRSVDLAAADLAPFSVALKSHIDMIFGADLMRGSLEIEPARRRLRLRRSGLVWSEVTSLPLSRTDNGHYYYSSFRLSDGAPFTAIIDTGFASGVQLSAAAAATAYPSGLPATTGAMQTWTGIAVAPLTFAPAVSLNGHLVEGVELWTEPPGAEVRHLQPADGIVGMQVLSQFHMLADFGRGRMFLRPAGVNATPARRVTVGLQGVVRGPAYEIIHVMKNSPAESAGWRVGDRICSVNNVPAVQIAHHPEARHWRRLAAGGTLKFGMCDGSRRKLVSREFY